MSDLMEIREFIQRIAQGITFAIGIDTQVIDRDMERVAGTVYTVPYTHLDVYKRQSLRRGSCKRVYLQRQGTDQLSHRGRNPHQNGFCGSPGDSGQNHSPGADQEFRAGDRSRQIRRGL